MKTPPLPLMLAPMAGAGDRAFRETCALFGVDGFVSEMISAKAVCYGDKKTALLAEFSSRERPFSLQLFGNEPALLARAARELCDTFHPDFIDLNFGCPVPKIVNNGEGSALMKDPSLCGRIVAAVSEAVPVPVTVKMRAGWDETRQNAPEVARLCEKAGAVRIAVHGRTRNDFYREGTLRPESIRAVKEAVSVPVLANGDVRDAQSARSLWEKTGCDGWMIGRAAVGAPWVFAELRRDLYGTPVPSISKKETIRHHLELAFRYKPQSAGREMRMHMAQYLKGFRGAAGLRDRASHAETPKDYLSLLAELPETLL